MENNNQENINQQFEQQFGTPAAQHPTPAPMRGPMELPNSTAVLVLGILSIVGCFCYTLPGVALGIISLVLAGRATNVYNQNPSLFTDASFKNMKAGNSCGSVCCATSVT